VSVGDEIICAKESIAEPLDITKLPTQSCVITSNDPDSTKQQIEDQLKKQAIDVVTVPIHQKTTRSALFDRINITKQPMTTPSGKAYTQHNFSYQEYALLTDLRQGKTVVLTGDMGLSLYQQLETLGSSVFCVAACSH